MNEPVAPRETPETARRHATDLTGEHLAPLLAEAARVRGRGLWQDARARLGRNRAARWSLRFLLGVALVALLAPLLPLPSPMALELAAEPGPPQWDRLGDRNWAHRTALHFRFDETLRLRELSFRAESALVGLVTRVAGVQPEVFRSVHAGQMEALELALPYRPEFDALRGSELETRVRTELAARMENGRLALKNGGSVAVSLVGLTAQNGYWELSAVDRLLLAARQHLFGFWQSAPWLGTDSKGRDLLARIVWGSRVSLTVGLAAALVSLVIGVLYGAVAASCGGWVDSLMMRVVDVLYSIPFLFVVIFVITILSSYRATLAERYGIGRMTAFFAVLGMVTWLTMARVVRGQVLALKNQEFVSAARALGASRARILRVHLLPNVLGVVVVYLTLTIPSVLLFEAFLSFLGLGVEPPEVSWGLLAVDAIEAINPLKTFWWLVLWPSLAMGATLLALNVLGDGLRDALDPRLEQR